MLIPFLLEPYFLTNVSKLPLILSGILVLSIIPLAFGEFEDTIVVLETNSGDLVIEFFPNDAPLHVENFLSLISPSGFYDDTSFHRIIPGFMIQGGDPNTKFNPENEANWGKGNPGYYIEAEFNDIKHERGILSMARGPDPNSAGSQFFIVHKDSTFLDGQYTVFGRLVTQESLETLDKIASLQTDQRDIPIDREAPKIIKTQVLERSDFDNLLELDPPERTLQFSSNFDKDDGRYTDKELGFSFLKPIGWTTTNPESTSSNSPQVATLGPASQGIPVVFAVNVKNSTSSLDKHILDVENIFLPMIDSGTVKILTEEKINTKKGDGYKIILTQIFTKPNSETVNLKIEFLLIKTPEKLYTLQFTSVEEMFDDFMDGQFKDILDSFTIMESIPQASGINETELESSEGGGCLIATAAYGSEMAPQVQFLREIRDNTVLQTQSGTSFMTAFNTLYYTFSPTVADYERENPVFKEAVKVGLTPLLTSLTILNYVDIDTEQEMLGYGIGIIMLNIGMYFVAPAVVIIALKKRRR